MPRRRYGGLHTEVSGADVATPTLVSVKVVEVGNDNRNRKCDGEHAGDYAQSADQLAPDTDRCDVTVADRCHGYDDPPEGARDGRELGARLAGLGVVGRRTEDHHGDEEEEEEHSELTQAGLDGHSENPQTLNHKTTAGKINNPLTSIVAIWVHL